MNHDFEVFLRKGSRAGIFIALEQAAAANGLSVEGLLDKIARGIKHVWDASCKGPNHTELDGAPDRFKRDFDLLCDETYEGVVVRFGVQYARERLIVIEMKYPGDQSAL